MKTVLITGASSGIGLEFAKLFAQKKYSLVLVSRDKKKLQEIAKNFKHYGTVSYIIEKDLTKENAAQEIYNALKKQNIEVNILINNAGFGAFGSFSEIELKNQEDMIKLNILTLTEMTHLFLNDMIKKNEGRILNISSTAAFLPGPFMAVYFATKSYVLSFSNALNNELKKTNIQVSILCPGPTDTEFKKRASQPQIKLFKNPMSAKDVALVGYEGLMKGKRVIIPGFRNNFLAFSVKFSPVSMVMNIMKKLYNK